MKLSVSLFNPVTLKRLRRFRKRKRAFWSFVLLAGLWIISLGSELICNDRPIFLRYEGESYFPVFKYYPESAFLEDGKETRPDYKKLEKTPPFAEEPGNFMIFPMVRSGPYESIDPESLSSRETVTLSLRRIPHVGSVDIDSELKIVKSRSASVFFGLEDEDLSGLKITDHWPIGGSFKAAIKARFANAEVPALEASMDRNDGGMRSAVLKLSAFRKRSHPPGSVRIRFYEPVSELSADNSVEFTRDLQVPGSIPELWHRLSSEERSTLEGYVRSCFDAPVYPRPIIVSAKKFGVDVRRNDIAWPHPPIEGHWLGIDSAGRDVFARVLYGLRISMTFGLLLVLVSMTIGIAVGALQGYFAGAADITGQRLIEIWSAVPFLYVMILMGSVYGRSFWLLILCYGIFRWIGVSYYSRAEFLRLRGRPFVDSARCMGIPSGKIMIRHILPNALTPIITFFPFSLVGAIGMLAALDYLGFGLPPPTPSWGELLHQAQQFRWAWWLILYPSLALFVVMLLGVFVGEGARDAFDPRPYSRME